MLQTILIAVKEVKSHALLVKRKVNNNSNFLELDRNIDLHPPLRYRCRCSSKAIEHSYLLTRERQVAPRITSNKFNNYCPLFCKWQVQMSFALDVIGSLIPEFRDYSDLPGSHSELREFIRIV